MRAACCQMQLKSPRKNVHRKKIRDHQESPQSMRWPIPKDGTLGGGEGYTATQEMSQIFFTLRPVTCFHSNDPYTRHHSPTTFKWFVLDEMILVNSQYSSFAIYTTCLGKGIGKIKPGSWLTACSMAICTTSSLCMVTVEEVAASMTGNYVSNVRK